MLVVLEGPEKAGKTTVARHIMANLRKSNIVYRRHIKGDSNHQTIMNDLDFALSHPDDLIIFDRWWPSELVYRPFDGSPTPYRSATRLWRRGTGAWLMRLGYGLWFCRRSKYSKSGVRFLTPRIFRYLWSGNIRSTAICYPQGNGGIYRPGRRIWLPVWRICGMGCWTLTGGGRLSAPLGRGIGTPTSPQQGRLRGGVAARPDFGG